MLDPVVVSVANALLQHGYRVIRFNSRGVGSSQGKASWTGEAEAADFQAIVQQGAANFGGDQSSSTAHEPGSHPAGVPLIIAGYSAGAMYASAVRLASYPPPFTAAATTYLLISYPLDKLWALSCCKTSTWKRRMIAIAPERLVLVQGTQDQFTKAASYEAWVKELESERERGGPRTTTIAASTFHSKTVQGADHFWSQLEHRQRLLEAVSRFVVSERGDI